MDNLKTLTERAFKEHNAGNLDYAESMYDSLLSQLVEPDFNVIYGYGSLMAQRERFGIALSLLSTARAMQPLHPGVLCNLGVVLKYTGRDADSLECYKLALSVEKSAEVLAGMAGYYVNRNSSKLCESYARKSIAKADLPGAHLNLALALLEQGRFEEAWPHYEHRWDSAERLKWKRSYTSPKWDGKQVGRLVIHGEQGIGDEILFMSLFARARALAKEVIIECTPRLVKIFSDTFHCPCYGSEQELKDAEAPEDAHIAMGSLPLVLGLPDGKPFMPRPKTTNVGKPIIGIAWRGGTLRTNKGVRTLKLAQLEPILTSIDANFISVQYGGEEIDEELKHFAIKDGPRDLDSLHYRIGICDLVITPCQTAVHQAGAMGVPCWVLTPLNSAWRYCRSDMLPWYESVSLFKQGSSGSWTPVINRIVEKLRHRYARAA